jgi:cell division protein FtsB
MTTTEQKPRSNNALLALVVLLIVSNLATLYFLNKGSNTVEQQQEQIATISDDKDNVTKLLEDMLVQYDTLSTENEQLTAEMAAQKQQIEDLMTKVKNGNYSLSKAKKEAETLRKIMKGYVVTIDSLNQANLALQADKANLTNELGVVSGEKAALEEKSRSQEEIISRGAVLHTTAISAGALFLRDSGKQVDTERAKRAEMVKCCFTLGVNTVTSAGAKTLYMRIISPDGSVLPASDGNNRFQFNGVEGEYSAKREMDYANAPVDVCVFWTATGAMKTGHYNVEIYENKALVSKTGFDLK